MMGGAPDPPAAGPGRAHHVTPATTGPASQPSDPGRTRSARRRRVRPHPRPAGPASALLARQPGRVSSEPALRPEAASMLRPATTCGRTRQRAARRRFTPGTSRAVPAPPRRPGSHGAAPEATRFTAGSPRERSRSARMPELAPRRRGPRAHVMIGVNCHTDSDCGETLLRATKSRTRQVHGGNGDADHPPISLSVNRHFTTQPGNKFERLPDWTSSRLRDSREDHCEITRFLRQHANPVQSG
jgi:hypothetical protein